MRISDWSSDVCSSDLAPFDAPRYAAAVVIEHGGGSGAAYPIARDVMTFLFDREKAMAALEGFEAGWGGARSEEHTSELQSLMRISYAVFCLKKKKKNKRYEK